MKQFVTRLREKDENFLIVYECKREGDKMFYEGKGFSSPDEHTKALEHNYVLSFNFRRDSKTWNSPGSILIDTETEDLNHLTWELLQMIIIGIYEFENPGRELTVSIE